MTKGGTEPQPHSLCPTPVLSQRLQGIMLHNTRKPIANLTLWLLRAPQAWGSHFTFPFLPTWGSAGGGKQGRRNSNNSKKGDFPTAAGQVCYRETFNGARDNLSHLSDPSTLSIRAGEASLAAEPSQRHTELCGRHCRCVPRREIGAEPSPAGR